MTKSASLARLSKAERAIILSILDEVTARGLTVSIFDGEEWPLRCSTDRDRIEADIAATCETKLAIREANTPLTEPGVDPAWHKPGKIVGNVWLIHGNDVDVIADHSDNPRMAEILAPAERLRDDFCTYAASKGLRR